VRFGRAHGQGIAMYLQDTKRRTLLPR
jgi:hypothetical protein